MAVRVGWRIHTAALVLPRRLSSLPLGYVSVTVAMRMASAGLAASPGHANAAAASALASKTLLFAAVLLRLLLSVHIVQALAPSRGAVTTTSIAADVAFCLLLIRLSVGLAFYATAQLQVQQ